MKMSKSISFLLAMMMSMSIFASCNKEGKKPNEKIDVVVDNTANYTLVRPAKEDGKFIASVFKLADAITIATGVDFPVITDADTAGSEEESAKEILVGLTNRPQSETAKNKISGMGFIIEAIDNKIVIYATHSVMLDDAINYFISEYLSADKSVGSVGEGYFALDSNLSYLKNDYQPINLVENKLSKYVIVYPATLGENEREVVKTVSSTIENLTGVLLLSISDSANVPSDTKGEIIVGATNREATKIAFQTIGANEYTIKTDGNDLVVAGQSKAATEKAALALANALKSNALKNDKAAGEFSLLPFTLTNTWNNQWLSDIPEFEGGEISGVYDSNEKAYQIYITDTNLSEYSAYRAKLEDDGYKLYDENVILGNSFATYTKRSTMIYTYYVEYLNAVRIIVSPLGDLPQPKSENTYTKICESKLTNIPLDTDAGKFGMSFVVRLHDSSFIVFDGGQNWEPDGKKLYDILAEQNVASGKPVIAAWIFTHSHADHKGGFQVFASKYADKVEIETIIYNSTAKSESLDSHNPDYYFDTNFPIDAAKFGEVRLITPRTGQKFYFRNAEFEVLYTHEDLYPAHMSLFNNTSTVMRMTLGGQKFMWLGDVEYDGSDVLCAMYGDYLKSDFVQVAHHGGVGGTIELYKFIDAGAAFWSCSAKQYLRVQEYEPGSIYLVFRSNVKEHFVWEISPITIDLPYTLKK